MIWAEKVSELQAALRNKHAELTAAIGERDAHAAKITELTATNASQATRISELEGQVTTLTSENTQLQGKVTAAEGSIQAAVDERLSAMGVPPVSRGGEAQNAPGNNKSTAGLTGLARTTAAFTKK